MGRAGMCTGGDLEITRKVTQATFAPIMGNNGTGPIAHIGTAVTKAGVSAVALGGMVVYQEKRVDVLEDCRGRLALKRVLTTTEKSA